MDKKLIEKVSDSPVEPGVYLMKNVKGHVIYAGKAMNLKKRLESYFVHTGVKDKKTEVLLKKITDFETIITTSEKEALILESNLIKRYKPRYNIILKDDKRYPSLCLNISEPYPYLSVKRKIKKDGSLYFGPYTYASAVSQTLKVINKTFKLRKCKTRNPQTRSRPCLNYQMHLCLAPCCLNVDKAEYNKIVREVILFLKGRTTELIKTIEKDMLQASEDMDFEKAASLRDKLFALKKVLEKQVIVSTDFVDRDVIALAGTKERSVITILFVRSGFLVGTRNVVLQETLASDSESMSSFIRQFYHEDRFVPAELSMAIQPEDKELLEDWLKTIKGRKVKILIPKRGEKIKLVALAVRNAEKALKDSIDSDKIISDMLKRLKKRLNIQKLPERIECFDNSNISGTSPVAGVVVYKNGAPDKSSYRKYKIRSNQKSDDYAYMNEVLNRRFKNRSSSELPDLLMVDGGKGQLNIALSVLKELGIEGEFDVIGIAKKDGLKEEKEDKIYTPGRANPVNLGREGDLLLFLQKIRDEAHRFAISFHRKQRRSKQIRSELDGIPGIGEKRKKMLLTHFKSIRKIRAADINELSSLSGMNRKIAQTLKSHLGA
ncbi:MAG: excinuclease ABC subunit UvrC [Deltaproteobacteria bacterium]|nr:excinuclease ABC subunit UvrC [Deltaproteobacteria bacterium]MBW2218118.1 excinuclease ABC subunit UvrC [Deltaproteobacteria bacterium]